MESSKSYKAGFDVLIPLPHPTPPRELLVTFTSTHCLYPSYAPPLTLRSGDLKSAIPSKHVLTYPMHFNVLAGWGMLIYLLIDAYLWDVA